VNVLGIWDGHDSGAALLQDGRLAVAVNEERLTRRKLEVHFPSHAIDACLARAGIAPDAIHLVAIAGSDPAKTLTRWWPAAKERYYATRRRRAAPGALSSLTRRLKYAVTEWKPHPPLAALSRAALRAPLARHGLSGATLRLVDHHAAHAAAAACASRFAPCAVVTIDGVGDGLSATISTFRGDRLDRVAASPASASLGVFFEHVTNLLNMRELEDEGKVMALADYAAPVADGDNPLLDWVRVHDGRIRVRPAGYRLRAALAAVQWRFPNEQFAFLAQRVVEQTAMALARDAVRLTGLHRVALAGGVVSNIRATQRVRRMPEIEDVYVFPHMGDGGLAVGAAALAALEAGQRVDVNADALDLGPSYDEREIAAALAGAGLRADRTEAIAARAAQALEDGRIVMWFEGRMEYGPRALGHRSVLARPDRSELRDRLNLALKRRVWYQPFCPSMLESDASRVLADWNGGRNRAMTMAYDVAPCWRTRLAGVISVNGTCRPHIVADDAGGAFADLLREARVRWGAGVVLNTSFNIHGEPMVCSPGQAVDVFLRSGGDALAIGPFFVERPGERS
jgi:carbamoyltransferase